MLLLDGAQTYIGVLATFIVLCLFNNKGNEDNGNFLFSIFVKIGEGIQTFVTEYILELKYEINSIYENKEERRKERVSELLEKANPVNKTRLLINRNAARMQENKFFIEAMNIKNQFNPTNEIKKKEEFTFVALFSLIMILVIMFVDCLEFINIEIRVVYVNLLIALGCVYSYFLYRNFFIQNLANLSCEVQNENTPERFKKVDKGWMIVKVFLAFICWLILISFVNQTWLSVLLLPFILGIGFLLIKARWSELCIRYSRYNRIFILKHSAYILLFAGGCTLLIHLLLSYDFLYTYMEQNGQIKMLSDWNEAIALLQNKSLAKYASLVFFTLNGFFLPLLFGYIYLFIKEHLIMNEIKKIQKPHKSMVLQYEDEFRRIESEIEKQGN